jgi:hypothetical protein
MSEKRKKDMESHDEYGVLGGIFFGVPARASASGSQISWMMFSASAGDVVASMECWANAAATLAHACCS